MKRRIFLKNTGAAGLLTLITPAGLVQALNKPADQSLEQAFRQPSASALPQTWWHWMNGNVTKEGITLDLEAMQRIGVGGVQNFDAGTGIPKGSVNYLSPEWLDLKKHAIHEAERLGLEFTMHNCPGWSSSGGPWITPALAMQQLTWSETRIKGGRRLNTTLPKPLTNLNYYQDVAVLAYPALSGEISLLALLNKATSGNNPVDINNLTGANEQGVLISLAQPDQPGFLQLEFKQPYQASGIAFISSAAGNSAAGGSSVTLEASDDGIQFRPVTTLNAGNTKEAILVTADFPAVQAKYFRLTSGQARHVAQLHFYSVPRVADWMKKANYAFNNTGLKATAVENQATPAIPLHAIQDISTYMNKTGKLNWNAPAGNWTVLRLGYTPIGTLNRSAPDTGIGLECDKYNPEAITFHFNKMMENLLPTLSPLAAKGKVGLLIDSWEVGMQNWTARFPSLFQQRNGYNIIKYLPALTGRMVNNLNTTERFLWDLRRTQADMLADNYYGKFDELCNKNGMISYTEPYDRGPMEEMQIGARVDVNMGEFWNGLSTLFQNNWTMRRTVKLAASIAHINGQKVVGAESFTGEPESARWQEYPFAMKALGDKMFTQGLNRIIFHRYAHQPHPTALPGMTMGPWGIHFDRTTTWWNQGKAWISYLSRCQSMLQQGLFVADLAYFTGEEGNAYTRVNKEDLVPMPPAGYNYDLINAEVLLNKAKVENGRLVLPDGMSYRVLVLQNTKGLTLALLHKLHALVKEGMLLLGAKPAYSLGLRGYPENEGNFKQLTADLWDNRNSASVSGNTFGSGRVFGEQPILNVLENIKLKPDFEVSSRFGEAPVTYIHRRINETEVYFIANQRRSQEDLVCTFRINNKQPELWDADTGQLKLVGVFEITDGRVRIPLQLGPAGSVFVVFRSPAPTQHLQAIRKDNVPVLGAKPFNTAARQLYKDITQNFTISLWVKPESNVMLSTRNFMEGIADPWTDYYTIYPPPGNKLYGANHATCGLTVGRNGMAVWEHGGGKPVLALAAPVAISGWSHIALVYKEGAPLVYVNGQLVQQGKSSGKVMHPGIGEAYLSEEASFYNGDLTEPQLSPDALNEEQIQQLAAKQVSLPPAIPVVEVAGNAKPELLFWQNGRYTLKDNQGRTTTLPITGIHKPIAITGSWQVDFPANMGAPAQITLPQLNSWHKHEQDGVKYFSGTATYRKSFHIPASALAAKTGKGRHLFLDLGQVEVIAEVKVNGKDMGVLWKRPYRVDVTSAVQPGINNLEIQVTNLWPNRLIGDEQVSDKNKFTAGAGASGFASLSNGAIEQLPEWYQQGKPKPENGRVTFTTWKHYSKDSPLLESGLIGPVVLFSTIQKLISDVL